MHRYFIIYKPYLVLSQFTKEYDKHQTLKDLFDLPSDIYAVGRLDNDSEGLLILTNDKQLNHKLLDPGFKHEREYRVQVEGSITAAAMQQLETGITISVNGKRYRTMPCKVKLLEEPPGIQERNPPIRFRKNVPVSWISMTLIEGKNRQVRKMTAAVGFPTLRLVRYRIEGITLGEMRPGDMIELTKERIYQYLFKHARNK
jgi:23S rRNA pseudouridine2457 synthase